MADRFKDAFLDSCERFISMRGYQSLETDFAKLLAAGRRRFSDPIGIEHQQVRWLKDDLTHVKLGGREHP